MLHGALLPVEWAFTSVAVDVALQLGQVPDISITVNTGLGMLRRHVRIDF